MLKVLRAKFVQNAECKEALLATGDAYMAEHTTKGLCLVAPRETWLAVVE